MSRLWPIVLVVGLSAVPATVDAAGEGVELGECTDDWPATWELAERLSVMEERMGAMDVHENPPTVAVDTGLTFPVVVLGLLILAGLFPLWVLAAIAAALNRKLTGVEEEVALLRDAVLRVTFGAANPEPPPAARPPQPQQRPAREPSSTGGVRRQPLRQVPVDPPSEDEQVDEDFRRRLRGGRTAEVPQVRERASEAPTRGAVGPLGAALVVETWQRAKQVEPFLTQTLVSAFAQVGIRVRVVEEGSVLWVGERVGDTEYGVPRPGARMETVATWFDLESGFHRNDLVDLVIPAERARGGPVRPGRVRPDRSGL